MRNVLFGVVLALAGLGATGCKKADTHKNMDSAEQAAADIPKLTPDQVEAQIASKAITPVDCNGDGTRKKMGVVPGAILISDEEEYGPSELPADKSTKLVFYCASET